MDRLIRVKVDGHHLTKDHRTAGVQHESNAAKMRIEFDPSWDGYAKKITFWNADGKNPVERMLTADLLENIAENIRAYRCFIPGEAMTEAGDLTFIIDGYVDGKRQRSLSDTLEVEPAPYIEQADQPADPTPTQAEQLQVQIERLLGDVQANAVRAEQARLGAEKARSDAEAIILGETVPEITLKDKADLVDGKVPKTQLPTLTAADVGALADNFPYASDLLAIARNTAVRTGSQTLNTPYKAGVTNYASGVCYVSYVDEQYSTLLYISSGAREVFLQTCAKGVRSEWTRIPTLEDVVSKSGDSMTGPLRIGISGGSGTLVADAACAYIQAYRDNGWDKRRALLLRNKETAPDIANALVVAEAGSSAAEYTVLHTGNLQLISHLFSGGGKVKVGSYLGSGSYGGTSPNSIQLDFEPDMVIVQDAGMNGAMVWGMWIRGCLMFMSYTSTYSAFVQDSSRNFKWASTVSAAGQFNSNGVAYGYIAIKFG